MICEPLVMADSRMNGEMGIVGKTIVGILIGAGIVELFRKGQMPQ